MASKLARTDLIPGEVQRVVVTDPDFAGVALQFNTGGTGVADPLFTPGSDYAYSAIEFSTVADTWNVRNFT